MLHQIKILCYTLKIVITMFDISDDRIIFLCSFKTCVFSDDFWTVESFLLYQKVRLPRHKFRLKPICYSIFSHTIFDSSHTYSKLSLPYHSENVTFIFLASVTELLLWKMSWIILTYCINPEILLYPLVWILCC